MAKVYPRAVLPSTSTYSTFKQEVFTLWMKSLIYGGKGCTVYDSNGQIVYRVDNYNRKDNNEVYLMDLKGKVLFTIFRKKFNLLGHWEGYRSTDAGSNMGSSPGFQVKRLFSIRRWKSRCEVIVGLDENQPRCYEIQRSTSSKYDSACKIVDKFGGMIAEVKRKRSTGGVDLGGDVLTMVVEPSFDKSLVMGLVVGHSLLNSIM